MRPVSEQDEWTRHLTIAAVIARESEQSGVRRSSKASARFSPGDL